MGLDKPPDVTASSVGDVLTICIGMSDILSINRVKAMLMILPASCLNLIDYPP
jgi:hypothetical protein